MTLRSPVIFHSRFLVVRICHRILRHCLNRPDSFRSARCAIYFILLVILALLELLSVTGVLTWTTISLDMLSE